MEIEQGPRDKGQEQAKKLVYVLGTTRRGAPGSEDVNVAAARAGGGVEAAVGLTGFNGHSA